MTTLPRRAFLGARLPPDDVAFGAAGVHIEAVPGGGMAAAAGVRAGDVLTAIGERPARSPCELGEALRAAGGAANTELAIDRDGARLVLPTAVIPCPLERIDGQIVSYEELSVDGARLRTIVTVPDGRPPKAAVIWLPGIACESVDLGSDERSPLAALIRAWAGADIMTVRFDKRGVGDSEGGPCGELDFDTELADTRRVVEAVLSDPRTGDAPLFGFGHSVGGMMAPLVGSWLDGLMVYGTSARSWLTVVEESTRRQLALRGVATRAIHQHIEQLSERIARDGLNGRSADYHRQLAAVDLPAAWRAFPGERVFVLRGEYDWVVGTDEQEELVELLGPGVTACDLPGLDHLLGWHPDADASLRDYGAGASEPTLGALTRAWMLGEV